MRNHLKFNKSKIYPDNSHIRWEIDGKGFFGNRLLFALRTNDTSVGETCFISVLERDEKSSILDSNIFWEIDEWCKTPEKGFFNQARQAAMQWAENYLMDVVTNKLSLT